MDTQSLSARQRSCMDGPAVDHRDVPGGWAQSLNADPAARSTVRRIAASWRRLTGGRETPDPDRRTLVACSGGADSTALLLALAAACPERIVAAHVRHDLRPEADAAADERAVEALARRLGVGFTRADVAVRSRPGNVEANARRARYAALATLASEQGCRFVATGHQADDVLETMLMRLVRGAGPRGLAGIAPRRQMAVGPDPATPARAPLLLVRPMLEATHADAEAICRAAGVAWQRDATNADTTRWRARLRRDVLPVLRELRADAAIRAAASARLLREAAGMLEQEARVLLDSGRVPRPAAAAEPGATYEWPRSRIDGVPGVVLGEALRLLDASLRERDVRSIRRGLRGPDRRRRAWAFGRIRVAADRERVTIHIANAPDDARAADVSRRSGRS
ncbi:MAG: tRNA lysidine(34) synthetase TilS [Phycisphaerales bacterium]